MQERVAAARQDSDTALFYDLLYYGELVTKLAVVGLVAGIRDDSDRHRYRLMHRLVRADGIGEWSAALSDATVGPAATHLADGLNEDRAAIGQNATAGAWQHDAITALFDALCCFGAQREKLPTRLSLHRWFTMFAELRNRTRGHGAAKASACSQACPRLENAVELLVENLPMFSRPWAYLHRNLSGKYRVTSIGGDIAPFAHLKSSTSETLADGVYVFADGMGQVAKCV